MPPFRKPSLVTLRRQNSSQPWGFRLIGGVNHGQPFTVQKVIPDSIAFRSGLHEGDELIRIGNITLKGLTHEEVQEIILRCISTIDLFVIRNDENSSNPTREQQTNNIEYNSSINSYSPENIAKSLTEQVQVETEGAYYTNSFDYNSPTSPPLQQQFYMREQESYQYSDYYSPPLSKRPQSPLQKPPLSGRPFSPPNASSSTISYHQAEEQQWLSTSVPDQQKDTRVFASSPRPQSSSQSPVPGYQRSNEQQESLPNPEQQRDNRVFAVSPRPPPSQSPSPSPIPNYQQTNEQNWSPQQQPRDTRVFGAQPRQARSMSPKPIVLNGQHNQPSYSETGPKTPTVRDQPNQDAFNYSYENLQNQRSFDSQFSPNRPQDNRVFGGNRKPETFENRGNSRPQVGRVINDRRVFGTHNKSRLQRMGGSLDETPHWKEPLPQLSGVKTDQLLPSQARQHQTYIIQTPPTEKLQRPPLTGTVRRRIRPVWPPPDHQRRVIPKAGFNPGGRDSPSKRYNWPPQSQSFDDEYYYENGIMSPNYAGSPNRFKYSTPPPGALQHAWNPNSGSETPSGIRSYQSSQRVKNTEWPPPSNATPAGRSGYRPGLSSLPGSRRSSQVEDYIAYGSSNRIPQTYRPPPGTQYFQQTYHYDTD